MQGYTRPNKRGDTGKNLFISQPTRGKTDEEILKERKALIADVYMKTHEEIEVIKSFFRGRPG